jgi:hypothetical protein
MIDNEKLKLANTLAMKTNNYYFEITMGIELSPTWFLISCDDEGNKTKTENVDSLDDLIAKLQELIKPEPKYKVGDEVWRLNDGDEPLDFTITEIASDLITSSERIDYHYKDDGDFYWWHESQLYPSLEALIQSQIDHWQELKQEFCEHSYDTVRYSITDEASLSIQCCSKCGKDKPEDTKAFEGQIQGFNDHKEDELEKVVNQYGTPQMFETTCCGEKLYYTNLFETYIPRCPKCNRDLRENCEHEQGKSTTTNQLPIATELVDCQHESDGQYYSQTPDVPKKKCTKCGEFYK